MDETDNLNVRANDQEKVMKTDFVVFLRARTRDKIIGKRCTSKISCVHNKFQMSMGN